MRGGFRFLHGGATADPGRLLRRTLLDVGAVKSSILERKSFRIGDVCLAVTHGEINRWRFTLRAIMSLAIFALLAGAINGGSYVIRTEPFL
jgi:hypothetical protein